MTNETNKELFSEQVEENSIAFFLKAFLFVAFIPSIYLVGKLITEIL
ncbi:MAG: hypothetical protein HRT61_05770 [Ekhidna sp.]|nr:hypothetical protein [Ekhidna sp.]